MPDLSVFNLDGLGEFGKAVVSAVQSCVGSIYEPTHIRRLATAQGDAAIIAAEKSAELTRIQERLLRMESRRQRNLDAVVARAARMDHPPPQGTTVDEDWIARFIDYAQDTGQQAMQDWWSRILAGEVASPGRFSLLTMEVVRTMTVLNATHFRAVCNHACLLNDAVPVVFDFPGVSKHLNECGIGHFHQKRLVQRGLLIEGLSMRGGVESRIVSGKRWGMDGVESGVPLYFSFSDIGIELFQITESTPCEESLQRSEEFLLSCGCRDLTVADSEPQ